MNSRSTIITGAIAGAIAVMLGAFGAHGLKPMLLESGRWDTFNLAVEYQFYHTLALLATGLISYHFDSRKFAYAAISFFVGIILFSGSLYLLSILNEPILGALTPFGGVAFILGWLFLAIGMLQNKKAPR
jgi:uncharacterized membrane protein YgdD (TMEM256/DUF423 family)